MYGHKPEVSESGLEDRVVRGGLVVEPFEEPSHLPFEAGSLWRLKVNALASDRARDHPHRARCVIAPGADLDAGHAAAARGKKRGMPVKQSCGREGLAVIAGGVQHHFNDAIYVSVSRRQRSDIHAKAAGDRRADLFGI
jgi:hypothetical protein